MFIVTFMLNMARNVTIIVLKSKSLPKFMTQHKGQIKKGRSNAIIVMRVVISLLENFFISDIDIQSLQAGLQSQYNGLHS